MTDRGMMWFPRSEERLAAEWPWLVDLICCGHDEGIEACASYEIADQFREDYCHADGPRPRRDRAALRVGGGMTRPVGRLDDWPTASCCGEPRVSPEVDACYDHAKLCPECRQQPMVPGAGACVWCEAPLPASVSATREGSQRGRSER